MEKSGCLHTADGSVECAAAMANVQQALKKLNVELPYDSTVPLPGGHTPKRTESRNFRKYLYWHVHSSIIHNNQKAEAAQVHRQIKG